MKYFVLNDYETGKNIFVRNDAIIATCEDTEKGGTLVACSTGHTFHVKEDPVEVVDKIVCSIGRKESTWFEVPVGELIEDYNLCHFLRLVGIKTVGRLAVETEESLSALLGDVEPALGEKEIKKIKENLYKWELSLGMSKEDVTTTPVSPFIFFEKF